MKLLFGESSPLVMAVLKLLDLVTLDLLWIITSIPLITLGMTTAAFYDTVYKDIWHGRGMVIMDYFSACRRNFKQAFPAGIVLTLLAAFMGIDIWLLRSMLENGQAFGYAWGLVAVALTLLGIYFLWLMAGIARFETTLKQLMLNSLALLLTHLPVSALIAAVVFACGLVIWLIPAGLFILPVIAMLGCCVLIDRVFRLYMTEEERQAEDEKNHSWRHQRKKG